MAREEKLVLKLEEKMKFQFQQYADQFGVTMSALGAFVIGQWVTSQNRLEAYNERLVAETAAAVQSRTSSISVDEGLDSLMGRPELIQKLFETFSELDRGKGQGDSVAGLDTEGHED